MTPRYKLQTLLIIAALAPPLLAFLWIAVSTLLDSGFWTRGYPPKVSQQDVVIRDDRSKTLVTTYADGTATRLPHP